MARMRTLSLRRTALLAALLIAALGLLLAGATGARAATVTVAPGDSLSGIAARNGTSVTALARANGIADPNVIVVGQRLTLPGAGTSSYGSGGSAAASTGGGSYRVRPGDTLGAIAARNGISVSALAALNGISNPNRITVGTVLSLPGSLPGSGSSSESYTPTASGDVAALIARHAARYGVSPTLARAIAWQESRWNQSARSHVGAVGVMQLMPATARWFGPAVLGRSVDPHNLNDNIEAGVAYLGWLMRQSGDLRTTIGGYYQGLASLRQRGPYDDTTDYINSVMSYMGRV